MSDDPLIRQLSKFTPDAAGLDRDALLFAAGRASARPNRRWQTLAGLLAATQLVTLGLFLIPATVPPAHPLKRMSLSPPIVQEANPMPPPEPISSGLQAYWQLREQLLSGDGKLPPLEITNTPMPDEPPLSALDLFKY